MEEEEGICMAMGAEWLMGEPWAEDIGEPLREVVRLLVRTVESIFRRPKVVWTFAPRSIAVLDCTGFGGGGG